MVGNRLKKLRNSLYKTQQQVANVLGITQQTYNGYELGRREPDTATLIKLANYFNVTVDFLLGHSDEKKEEDKKTIIEPNPNTVIAFGRGGKLKEFNLTDEQADMVNAMLEALSKKDK